MSFSLSWIAVKGPSKDAVLATLGLVEAPEVEEANEEADFPPAFDHSLAELPSGWIIILAKDFGYPTPKRMAALSEGGTAIACSIEEHVMCSVARCYADGQAVWSVDHNGGEKGSYHLDVAGAPPPEYAAVRDRLTAVQDAKGGADAQADYVFDVPGDLSEVLCGYKFDPERKDGPTFTALGRAKKAKGGGLLGRLFGRK
jgi:hypothetical protein